MQFIGDNGRFRRALADSGLGCVRNTIFNDNSKAKPSTNIRRLKLTFATQIFNAPQSSQRRLARELRKQFGERIVSMYFIADGPGWYIPNGTKALCIKLRDNV